MVKGPVAGISKSAKGIGSDVVCSAWTVERGSSSSTWKELLDCGDSLLVEASEVNA